MRAWWWKYQWAEVKSEWPKTRKVLLVWLAIAVAFIAVCAYVQWSSGPPGHDDGRVVCDYTRMGPDYC